MEEHVQPPKSNKAKFILLGSLVLVGLGAGAYFIWGRGTNEDPALTNLLKKDPEPAPEPTPSRSSRSRGGSSRDRSGFPLQRGSKGSTVREMQQALIKAFGAGVLPRFGADGDFGRETEGALRNNGLPTRVDAMTFAKIIAGNISKGSGTSGSTTDASSAPLTTDAAIAKRLLQNIDDKRFDWTLWDLKQIKDSNQYSLVSEQFKFQRQQKGMHVISLLSAALANFKGNEKHQIEGEFFRMGLKKDSSGKWTLSGLGFAISGKLITTRPTIVQGAKGSMEVPGKTVLGEQVRSTGSITYFSTIDEDLMTVPTSDVRVI